MQTVGREPLLLHQPGAPDAVAVRLLPNVGGSCAELTVAAKGATEAATMGAPRRYARPNDYLNAEEIGIPLMTRHVLRERHTRGRRPTPRVLLAARAESTSCLRLERSHGDTAEASSTQASAST